MEFLRRAGNVVTLQEIESRTKKGQAKGMATATVRIEPSILKWAVERAGMDVDAYSCRDSDYAKWLSGEKMPTYRQAEKFAKRVYLPVNYLFLKAPIQEPLPLTMFRSKSKGIGRLNVDDMVFMLDDRQVWLSSYLRGNNYDKVDYAGRLRGESNGAVVADKMREVLGLADDWALAHRDVDGALRHIIALLEDKGVVVASSSIVGNNTKRHIDVGECRGFCLFDDYAPFIFVNSGDAKTAQLFTLMHEFAHVIIGYSSGIGSGKDDLTNSTGQERLCNNAAARFLVPDQLMRSLWNVHHGDYSRISRLLKVSRQVVAIKAKDLGYISQAELDGLLDEWEIIDVPTKMKAGSGGNPMALLVKRYSRSFLTHVCNALGSNQLLYTEAFRMLNIRSSTFDKLVRSKEFQG